MHTIRLPIGDWSGDGHGHCEWYVLESNHSPQELRDLYFETTERVGCGLDSETKGPCQDYQDSEIRIDQLLDLGLNRDSFKWFPREDDEDVDDPDRHFMNSDQFAEPFVTFMKHHNTALVLNIIPDTEMFPFFGYDEQRRHIGFMGYGVLGP